jgi:tetratricopeptide (TPR) repeat protein
MLATCLRDQGKVEEAIAEAREGLRRGGHGLADVLASAGRADEAHDLLREVVRRNPDNPSLYWTLGNFQRVFLRDADAAISSFRRHIELDPQRGMAFGSDGHGGLGMALEMKGRHAEAIPVLREAERIAPSFYGGWLQHSLASALRAQGDLPAASEAFRRAIRHRPAEPQFHAELADVLTQQGDYGAAIAAYREAIRLKPDYAEAHCNLGHAQRGAGDFAGSLDELRRGHELGSKRPDWPHASAEWVRKAERLAALVDRLPAVLKGDDSPRDAAERLSFAQMAYDTRRFVAASRLWAEALESDPALAGDRQAQYRYHAACSASLAAAGKAEDDPKPDDAARAAWRHQALGWLKAELATWSEVLKSADPPARAAVAPTLRHWRRDLALAGVRDAPMALPEPERADWQALWAEVDRLVAEPAKVP